LIIILTIGKNNFLLVKLLSFNIDDMNLPSEQQPEKKSTDLEQVASPETLQEQYLHLKQEVEELYRDMEKQRGLLQPLVSGLIIAVSISIAISGWFAYRLLVQEQVALREAEKAAATNADMVGRLDNLEQELQLQTRELERVKTKIPEDLTETMSNNRQELELLRDRLEEMSKQLEDRSPPPNNQEPE